MRKIIFVFCFALSFFITTTAIAASPVITTFTIGSNSVFSGQLISTSWNGTDATGYNLLVTCATGVKIKKEDGTVYPCDTKVATSGSSPDSMGFYLINISGSSKTVTFKLYAKDSNGNEDTSAVQVQSVTISPSPVPISSVTSSATTTTSGYPISISWTSTDLDGINIIMSCVDGVTVSSSANSASLPCDTLMFTDKLSGSGNINLYFKNKNSDRPTVTLKVLPYIGDGGYDLTHAVQVNFDVASDKVLPFQILSFLSSQPKVSSGDSINLLWTTKYTNGVNLKFDCGDSLSFSLATSSGGQAVSCNSLISDSALGANSSVSVLINNSSSEIKTAYVTLMAQLPGGGYDGINANKIAIQVSPKGQTFVYDKTTINTTSVTPVVNQKTSNKKVISPRKKFLKMLAFGIKSDDVSVLQEFLSKNGYYPEGIVTGYMGALTTKAVKRFQDAYGIAKPGDVGYGNVGPATRAKLNSL